jgi:PAS domain S-box-containing protein
LEIARDTNSIVITDPIVVVQENSDKKSFLMLLPIYENGRGENLEERRENIQGFVVAALRAPNLFSDIVLSRSLTDITGLMVSDVTEGSSLLLPYINSLGSTSDLTKEKAPIVQTSRISFGTRTWQIDFKSDKKPEIGGVALIAPYVLFGLGIIISSLFALIVINSSRTRERAEELARDLTKDLEKFKLAVDNSSDHIVITDPEGVVLYANSSVERITGFKNEEVVGKKAGGKELWGGNMDKEIYQKLWHKIKVEKKSFSGEFTNHRKNGEEYVADANVSPVLDQNGEVTFFVGIERDITRVKELERMKDEFVSVASHELRTPMTAIKGFTSMILEGDYGKPPEKMVEPLTDIVTSTERLINLVNDMLNLSRITAGRLKFNVENFKAIDIAKETVKLLSPVAEKKGLKVILGEFSDTEIFGDKDKLSQVLNNLIGNSIKFTDKGEIKLTAKEDGDFLKIFVTDTGIGIAKKDEERLFQKFEQVSSAQTGKPQGTGLGLYISKQIAGKLGGDIWIESTEIGKGSTFGYSVLLAKSPEVNKIKTAIEKEAKINPDQKEMS